MSSIENEKPNLITNKLFSIEYLLVSTVLKSGMSPSCKLHSCLEIPFHRMIRHVPHNEVNFFDLFQEEKGKVLNLAEGLARANSNIVINQLTKGKKRKLDKDAVEEMVMVPVS